MKQEILIDAMYINDSGGKILLDYLIQELELTDKKVFYLLDKRVEHTVPFLNDSVNNKIFLEGSLLKRYRFYRANKERFESILCFGNLPPNIKLKSKVYTYFHQQLFIEIPANFSFFQKLSYNIKILILKQFSQNTTFFVVQSEIIQDKLAKKYDLNLDKIKILPFYPPLIITRSEKKKRSYIYISNAPPHKNHLRLIKAFCKFYDDKRTGTLTLTINRDYPELLEIIEDKQKAGYPIINIGFVQRDELKSIYSESEYLIYPSLAESFGLGLVEAIESGCKIIGADLPYTYAVCEPSLVFNPLDEDSITNALLLSLQENIKPSVSKISNKIDALINLL